MPEPTRLPPKGSAPKLAWKICMTSSSGRPRLPPGGWRESTWWCDTPGYGCWLALARLLAVVSLELLAMGMLRLGATLPPARRCASSGGVCERDAGPLCC